MQITLLITILFFCLIPHLGYTQEHGRFLWQYWYESGIDHGNPKFNSRFRVNSPEAVLHPSYGKRIETRGNGMMQILMEEDLFQLQGAELYLELWGGHPGTANKRVTINGRSTYLIPDETVHKYCTYTYPTIPLKITDLVNGYNALQFACDQGETFWGHYIVDNACLRAHLPADHERLQKLNLSTFQAGVKAETLAEQERITLALDVPESFIERIAQVEFRGYYEGYDENGDGRFIDWHGFTKSKNPHSNVGVSVEPPHHIDWDISMTPAQSDMKVRAIVSFRDEPSLIYETPVLEGLVVQHKDVSIQLLLAQDQPQPFWSRANRKQSCHFPIGVSPEKIERAELHIVIWDGGKGTVEHPFTLNGYPLEIAGEGRHDVLYRIVPIDPSWLRAEQNRFELVSDTEHHGIEVILPGPALMIRYAH